MVNTGDQSHLDLKYFIDPNVYNCPFCNRRHVTYKISHVSWFNWSQTKICNVYTVHCNSCGKDSMHLSFEHLLSTQNTLLRGEYHGVHFSEYTDIDSKIFYSVPTSFFVLDARIPAQIRELITEAEGSRKMNFLTGASACARKAIYELLIAQEAEGDSYEDRIKSLKVRFPNIDPDLFDVLGHIQDMTSDKVHEQSWPKWDSHHLTLIIETLKAVLHEIYVLPEEKKIRSTKIRSLLQSVRGKDATASEAVVTAKVNGS